MLIFEGVHLLSMVSSKKWLPTKLCLPRRKALWKDDILQKVLVENQPALRILGVSSCHLFGGSFLLSFVGWMPNLSRYFSNVGAARAFISKSAGQPSTPMRVAMYFSPFVADANIASLPPFLVNLEVSAAIWRFLRCGCWKVPSLTRMLDNCQMSGYIYMICSISIIDTHNDIQMTR